MKSIKFLLLFVLVTFAQNKINLNPDKSAEPWYIDNYTEPVTKTFITDQQKIQYLQYLQTLALPEMVNHAFSQYMRPVFNQDGGSCGSASRICYMFAYEINNYRRAKGSLAENKYPSHFTWLLTGQNSEKEEMAIANGVPNSVIYGGDTYSRTLGGKDVSWPDMQNAPDYGWMNGYDKWISTMQNRLEKTAFINLSTPENLLILKGWIYNHNGDTSFAEGGVAGAGVATAGMKTVIIPSGSYAAGKEIVQTWGPQVDHGVTWAGYDDNIAYDFNKDGKITNDIDITGDGKVDMADWEKGAMLILNSWGSGWANYGTVYVPYRLLKINNMNAELYYIRKDYKPKKIMKIKMDYGERSKIRVSVGISNGQSSARPDKSLICHHFNFAGNGDIPLLGKWADGKMHSEPMEFAYDLTDLDFGYNTAEPYTYFLRLNTKINSMANGKVYEVSVMDFSIDPSGKEYKADSSNVAILNNGKYTYITVKMPGNKGTGETLVYVPQNQMKIISCDSEETQGEDGKSANIIDGDQTTIWHTEWSQITPKHPHQVIIDLGNEFNVSGFEYLPRQSSENGRIKNYEFYLSTDGLTWNNSVAKGEWPNTSEKQLVKFNPAKTKFIKLVALSEVNNNTWTSCAELNVLSSATTDIKSPDVNVPADYTLKQNYPNPFNPSTTIEYSLPESGWVTLKVYDILGREISALVNEFQQTGNYAKFFALNSSMSSGVYVYRLSINNNILTKKMMYLK